MIRVTRETHELPADIQARIARIGERNFYGEPNFRIVWGRNVHAGEPNGPYPFAEPDRWYLERWIAPEICGVARGEYTLCDDSGLLDQYLPDTGVIENFLIPLIERSRGISFRERRAALARREGRREKELERKAYDVVDDAMPAFHGQPFSGPAGPTKSFAEKAEERQKQRKEQERQPHLGDTVIPV